jgi:hypothetical protein
MMGKNLKTGNKRPIPKDRMLASAQLPPLPKMYQMGIAKGIEQERERIIQLLKPDAERNQTDCEHGSKGDGPCGGCHYFIAPEDVIALIEGRSDE